MQQIAYAGSTPGTDSSDYDLYDSTTGSVGVIGSIPGGSITAIIPDYEQTDLPD